MVDNRGLKKEKIILSAVQLCSKPDVRANLQTIDKQIAKLEIKPNTTHVVVLPECCLFFGGKDAEQLALAQKSGSELIKALSNLALKYQIFLIAGTVPQVNSLGNKFTNSCFVFSPKGETLTQYDKIHLFDVNVEDNEKSYKESRLTQAGKQVVTTELPFSTLGLTVCYDVRFPELYRHLATLGANIITVPSAFTRVTGKAHWQALLQARAIENQVYIIAAAQEGIHENGRETWGHSMIISPWGDILANLDHGEGLISAEFSFEEIKRVRTSIPVREHNKFSTVPLF